MWSCTTQSVLTNQKIRRKVHRISSLSSNHNTLPLDSTANKSSLSTGISMAQSEKAEEILEKPHLTEEQAGQLVETLYGLKVTSLKPLDSYDDLNFYVKIDGPAAWAHGYTLKVMNGTDSKNEDLIEAQNQMMTFLADRGFPVPRIVPNLQGADMSLEQLLKKDNGAFQNALIIHNAASLGDMGKKAAEHSDPEILNKYYATNLTSVIALTAKFMEVFSGSNVRRTVVNISSAVAVEPLAYQSLYCSGKAARNMFFKVMAEEEPDVRVLSYSPGPMATDMLQAVRSCGDKKVEDRFNAMESQGLILSPDASAKHMCTLLEEDKFKSGAFLDVFGRFSL